MIGKRVLAFAPYGSWSVHHQLDAVVGTALRLRGAEMRVLLCDGLFRDCLLAGKPHDPEVCKSCHLFGQHLFRNFPVESRQIFEHLLPSDFTDAGVWSDSLAASGHPGAVFDGVTVGAFVKGTLFAYCKTSKLDYSQAETLSVSRSFLYNGALLVRAIRRHLREYRPDHALCFNGVHAYYRMFFELCRAEGIPVLVHEAGPTGKDFTLFPGYNNFDHVARRKEWEALRGAPLDAAGCSRVKDYFMDRAKTIKCGAVPIYGFETDPLKVRRALRLPEGKKIIGAFTTSDWEVGIGEGQIDFTYATQLEWLRETAVLCASEGHILVIRHHPNNARKDLLCKGFMRDLLKLNAEFGDNVRVLMPSEKLTSYGLLWSVDLAVSFITTMGAEASIRGIPSICVADSLYRGMGMEYVSDKGDYTSAIRRGLGRSRNEALEALRQAYRAAKYLYFSNYAFQSFGFRDGGMDLRLSDSKELLPGADPVLDAVCGHLLSGAPLRMPPSPDIGGRVRREEDAFLAAELDALDAMRAEMKSGSAWDSSSLPQVTILRLKTGNGATDAWEWERHMLRSRHRNVRAVEVMFPADAGFEERLCMLSAALAGDDRGFVYVASGNLVLDECVLSASVDLMSDAKNSSIPAVTWDGWLCGPDGSILDDIFGRDEPRDWKELAKKSALLNDPFILMGFMVSRTSHLRALLSDWASSNPEDRPALASAVFRRCLAPDAGGHAMRSPSLWLFPEREDNQTPMADMAFLYRILGDLGRAGDSYLSALDANPGDEMLAEEYFKVMREMGKADEARGELAKRAGASGSLPLSPAVVAGQPIVAGLRIKPANEGWVPVSPAASAGQSALRIKAPQSYADVASQVDTVKGWLLDGQEKYLFDKVKSLPDGACILEMGANFGRSTCAMAFACLGTDKHIYSVDTFSGNDGVMGRAQDFYPIWRGNLERLGLESHATALRGFTFDILADRSRFPPPLFVFIDASHEYHDVLQDFKDIYDYVPVGGWIAFHDVEVNWPGPWRVWMDYASHMLTDRVTVATLACGRKSVATPFGRAPDAPLGFSYAEAFIREFESRYTPASPLCRALRISRQGLAATQTEREALAEAEVRIAQAPEADFRSGLVNIMSVKDGGIDGCIRLWYALTLIADGKAEEAYRHLSEVSRVSYPLPAHRAAAHLHLIRENSKGPWPDALGVEDARFIVFRAFVKAGDTVIACGSGEGELLRTLPGALKIGIERDRESRKNAIMRFGIDSVENALELPDACADVLVCDGWLDKETAPLEALKTLFRKLKRQGKAVFRIPSGSASGASMAALYSWTPATLANLFRAAGFAAQPPREENGNILMTAERE